VLLVGMSSLFKASWKTEWFMDTLTKN